MYNLHGACATCKSYHQCYKGENMENLHSACATCISYRQCYGGGAIPEFMSICRELGPYGARLKCLSMHKSTKSVKVARARKYQHSRNKAIR